MTATAGKTERSSGWKEGDVRVSGTSPPHSEPNRLGAGLIFSMIVLMVTLSCVREKRPAISASNPGEPHEAETAAEVSAAGQPHEAASDADDPCQEIVSRFENELAGTATRCANDRECVCYQGLSSCGGVVDVHTFGRLRALIGMFQLAGCRRSGRKACQEQACRALCVVGKCVKTDIS